MENIRSPTSESRSNKKRSNHRAYILADTKKIINQKEASSLLTRKLVLIINLFFFCFFCRQLQGDNHLNARPRNLFKELLMVIFSFGINPMKIEL